MAGAVGGGDDDGISAINIVPLVDVILVLLIVFMITMPTIVGSAPVKVDVPETSTAAISADAVPLKFSLKREAGGDLQLYLQEEKADKERLPGMIKQLDLGGETTALLSADRTIPYGDVVKVMDTLSSLGFKKISLDTKHSGH